MSRGVQGPAVGPTLAKAGVTLLAGAGFGVVVVALNHAEPLPLRALSLVTGGGAGWAAFGTLVAAWWRRRLTTAVIAATLALAVAVAAYYAADSIPFGTPLGLYLRELRFWVVGALVVGPPLGLVGWRARRDGTWLGLVATLVVPLGFAAESVIYLDGFERVAPLELVTRLTIVAVALAVTVTLVGRQLARRSGHAAVRLRPPAPRQDVAGR